MKDIDKRYSSRIDPLEDVGELVEAVLVKYQKAKCTSYKVLEIGYEDFNLIIRIATENYFLKVFRNSRDDDEVETIVDRIAAAVEVGVPTPEIYKNPVSNKYWTTITIGSSRFRLCLMEYIDGKDFFTLGQKPTDDELVVIAEIAAKVSGTDYHPEFVYDSWAITSFLDEFPKKEQYLSGENLAMVREAYEEFAQFDYDALPKSFVHGDMMSTNILKDRSDEIWLIDFSVSNYTARLNEIIVVCGDLALIADDVERTRVRLKRAFDTWSKIVKATDLERRSFEMLYKVANAINIMNTNYEIATGNTSDETMMHLKAGRFGMSLIQGGLELI